MGNTRYYFHSSSRTQVSLLPPPWLLFTTRLPFRRATLCEAAGHDYYFLAVDDVGAEVDAAAFEVVFYEAGVLAELHDGLGDEVAGVGFDFFAEGSAFFFCRLVAHEHSVAAGFVGAFDDEFVEVFEDVFAVGIAGADVGWDVGQDRFLAEVELDHVGDEGVDGLVVGDAGADGVGEGEIADAVGVHEAGHAQDAVGAEAERIEEIIVDPAVEDVDPAQAGGGAHVDEAFIDDQIAAFDQFDAHLAGEEAVLEIGGVVDAGREDGDDGIVDVIAGRRTCRACRRLIRIILDRPGRGRR